MNPLESLKQKNIKKYIELEEYCISQDIKRLEQENQDFTIIDYDYIPSWQRN